MLELPFVFVAGLLGSAHCLGMCGPFAIALGSGATSGAANVGRQLLYTTGRVFTYGCLGVVAGFAGSRLQSWTTTLGNAAAVLALVAGVVLIHQGLSAAGVLRSSRRSHRSMICLGSRFLATFLRSPRMEGVFLAGVFTGFIPCGLLYGLLALAASSGQPLTAGGLMVVFGLGTVPVMLATGCGCSLLSPVGQVVLYRVAAWSVVVTGAITVFRGLSHVHVPGWFESSCPLCGWL